MLTENQAWRLARTFDMNHLGKTFDGSAAQGDEPITVHDFTEKHMVNCCWPYHIFAFADSVEEGLEQKLQEQIARRL